MGRENGPGSQQIRQTVHGRSGTKVKIGIAIVVFIGLSVTVIKERALILIEECLRNYKALRVAGETIIDVLDIYIDIKIY